MNERWEALKAHFRKHKTAYSCGLTALGTLGVAGFTHTIMRRNALLGGYGYSQREDQLVDTRSPQAGVSPLFSNVINNNTTTIYDNVKPMSKIVADLDNDRWWISQADVAKDLGETPVNISRHLNHDRPLTSGAKLTRMGIAS